MGRGDGATPVPGKYWDHTVMGEASTFYSCKLVYCLEEQPEYCVTETFSKCRRINKLNNLNMWHWCQKSEKLVPRLLVRVSYSHTQEVNAID